MRSEILLCFLFFGFALSARASETRILCLGDSITEGSPSFQVYRPLLAKKLADAGIEVKFVGPKKDKNGQHHGGYGGKSIEGVLVEYKKFHTEFPADVILIHSGHNHTIEEYPIPGILQATEQVISIARKDNPQVKILLAKVITAGKLPKYSYIPELNKQLEDLGKRLSVTIVDQADGFEWEKDTTADYVHPNAKGAEKMASTWFVALKPMLTASTQTVPPKDEIGTLPDSEWDALEKASKVLVYKTVDGLDLEMHVFLPEDAGDGKLRPGVLYIHGGGWTGGEPAVHALESLYLCRQGMVTATIRYRLLGDKKTKYFIGKSPADCLADAKSAMRFFRSHAKEFSMDPERIAASGGSAGGHLVAALNTVEGFDDPKDDLKISARANALILLYPAFDLVSGWGSGAAWCKRNGIDPKSFSPATLADESFPPTKILVGNLDPVSPPASNTAFIERMRKVHVPVELFTYAGKEHKLFERRKSDPHFRSYLIQSSRFFHELGWLPKQSLPALPEIEFTSVNSK